MVKVITIVISCLTLFMAVHPAQSSKQSSFTGAKLFKVCKGVVGTPEYETSLCLGYIRGACDEILIGNEVCAPDNIDAEKLTQKFLKVYLSGDLWAHHAASTFLHEAINALYPCD